jgi:hypothetical protein
MAVIDEVRTLADAWEPLAAGPTRGADVAWLWSSRRRRIAGTTSLAIDTSDADFFCCALVDIASLSALIDC